VTWERKLALCFFAVALLLAVSTCFAAFSRSERRVAYLAVMCPSNWVATISQRHDEGTIWRRGTWVNGCTNSYRIEWKP